MKIDAEEKELLESVERGEWKSGSGGKRQRARFSRYAKATLKKDRRLNIRPSSKELDARQWWNKCVRREEPLRGLATR